MTPCAHGYPSPTMCLACMDAEGLGAAPVPAEKITHTFFARYDGQCGACDLPIYPGQLCASTTNDRTIHNTCAGGMEVAS